MENDLLKADERLENLECNGLMLIQSKSGYCFTSDSVLIANKANVRTGDRVVDLGTGSGVIATLIAGKHKVKAVVGVEIQPRLADMARRSVRYNKLEEKITIVNADMVGVERTIGRDYDVVITNPPYEKTVPNKEEPSEDDICKCEIKVTVEQTVECAAKLLKFGGLFYIINKSRRLADVICAMRDNLIEPKKIWFIQPKQSKEIDTFIVEGKKNAGSGLILPRPIIVYEEDGTFTEFSRRLYNK